MTGGRALIAALLMAGAVMGCGHNVTPTDDFNDPASIPLPQNIRAISFHNSVTVTWFTEPEIFAFVDGWHVHRAEGDALPAGEDFLRINPDLVQRNDFRDDNVVDGTRYWYVVTSMSPSGIESLPTDPISVRVDATPPDAPAWIEAEVQFNATLNRYEVLVTWALSTAADVRHYNLYRDPGVPSLPVVPDLSDPRWIDNEVDPGQSYRYWITSVDQNLNESAAVDTATAEVPETS